MRKMMKEMKEMLMKRRIDWLYSHCCSRCASLVAEAGPGIGSRAQRGARTCADASRHRSCTCFFCSSLVGRPAAFWRWSYIIFSTVCRVSPSRSESDEFSGST